MYIAAVEGVCFPLIEGEDDHWDDDTFEKLCPENCEEHGTCMQGKSMKLFCHGTVLISELLTLSREVVAYV